MKNIFKLTEGDLTKIVKRVIKESIDTEKFLSKVSSVISFPYIDTLESFGIPKEDWEKSEYDDNGNKTYYENSDGDWYKQEYDEDGNEIYYEDSSGYVSTTDSDGYRRNNNLNESVDYYDKLLSILQPPYFENLRSIGIPEEHYETIFSKLFDQPVYIDFSGTIRNKKGKVIYIETSDGFWGKSEFDNNGNVIYYEQSDGYWRKQEYDNNGNVIHYENSNGYWIKQEYDEKGKLIYIENPDGEILNLR